MTAIRLAALVAMMFAGAIDVARSADFFVSATGSNTLQPCSRTDPCREIQFAINLAAAGDTVTCLTSGHYVSANINKSISIDCTAVDASVSYISVNTTDPSYVSIRGLTVDGKRAPYCPNFCNVVSFIGSGTLALEKVTVRNQFSIETASAGLNFNPRGRALLTITDSQFVNTGTGGAILIKPNGNALMSAVINRTVMETGTVGVKVDATATSGGIVKVDVRDSVAAHFLNNGYLALANAGNAQVRLKLTRATAFDNGSYAAVATGPQAFMIVSDSSLTESGTGLAQLNGSTVATYVNNDINFNTTNVAGTIATIARR